MKKKYAALAVMAAFAFALAGCGGKSTEESAAASEGEETAADNDKAEVGTGTEELGDTDKSSSAAGLLHPEIASIRRGGYVEGSGQNINFSSKASSAVLDEADAEKYPELSKALNEQYGKMKQLADKAYDELKENAQDMSEYESYDGSYMQLSSSYDTYVMRADQDILSMDIYYEDYFGGAHGYYADLGHTFDTRTGKELSIYDVITDKEAFSKALKAELAKNYAGDDGLIENSSVDDDVAAFFEYADTADDENVSWTLGYDRLNICFNPYSVGSYAMGSMKVSILFAEYPDAVKEEYTHAPDSYAVHIDSYDGFRADLSGDGNYVNISADYENYNDYTYDDIKIVLKGDNGQETSRSFDDMYYFSFDTYYVKLGNRHFLHILTNAEDDWTTDNVYEITDGKIESCGYVDAEPGCLYTDYSYGDDYNTSEERISAYCDPEELLLTTRLDALSTYSGWRYYRVAEDGLPYSDEPYRALAGDIKPKLIKEITAKLTDADGKETGESADIPAGTELSFYMTDNKSYVIFSLADGRYIKVDMDRSDWPYKVNGEELDSVLSDTVFAG